MAIIFKCHRKYVNLKVALNTINRFFILLLVLCSFRIQAAKISSIGENDTSFTIAFRGNPIRFSIHYPASQIKGTILLLHGWNLPSDEWCDKTTFCKKSLDSGFVLIVPDFGKTTYHFQIYPETILKYRKFPTREWMYDTAFVHLQNQFSLLLPTQNNFVCGLSTGGRGSALFALEKPELFSACAALSADFDQTKIIDEPINNGYYGSFKKFPDRWKGKDNIYNRANEFKVPAFLAHGVNDKICPFSQTENFYLLLKKINPNLQNEFFFEKTGGHNYQFWEKSTDKMISFFISHIK